MVELSPFMKKLREARKKQIKKTVGEGIRVAGFKQCTCPPDDMGWGCCCAQPLTFRPNEEGDFMVVPIKKDDDE